MPLWKCVPIAIYDGVDISEVPGCHLLRQISSQWGSQKLLQRLMYYEVTSYLSVLSKWRKLDNFESLNSLKLIFTNIRDLRLNFVECESFLESNSSGILALYEINLSDSTDSGNFSARDYLSLFGKNSVIRMHGLAVYVKEGLPIARDLSLENSASSYLCFRLPVLHSVSYIFSSINNLFRLYARFLMLFHLT